MKIFRYIAFNTFFAVILYFGFFQGIEGAKNVALFFIWFIIIVSVILLASSKEDKLKAGHKGRSVPVAVDMCFDIAIVSVLIWFDYWITGSLFFISAMLMTAYWEECHKLVGESKTKEKDPEDYAFFPPK